MMISGVLAPLVIVTFQLDTEGISLSETMQASSITNSWHDDCSNTTGWYENTTNIENLINEVQTGISLLTDGESLYSDTIPSSTTESHGPQFFKKIPSPLSLKDGLDLQVEIEHIGTSGYMGSVGIVLLDEFNATVYKVGGVDGWTGSECNGWVAYKEGDPQNIEYVTKSGSWTGTVRVWYNATTDSVMGDVTGTEFTLAASGSFNSNREVHFVGIVFYNLGSQLYESHVVKDILLTTSETVPPSISYWHHDCSNITAFDGVADDSWYGDPNVHIDGSIASQNGYIYADDYGTGSLSYGPMRYHSFSSPFPLSTFENLSVEFEMDASSATLMGAAAVVLFDQNNDTIIAINVADSWSGYSVAAAYASYDFANGTRVITPYTNPTWTATLPYNEMISVIRNVTGLYAQVPRVGTFFILASEHIENERSIASIAVNFRASTSAAICEINRIHEIYLNNFSAEQPQWPQVDNFQWHHDCSTTSGFVLNYTWPLDLWLNGINEWAITEGTINSDGDNLYFSGIPSASEGWHGPAYVHTLETPFSIYNFEEFTVDCYVDNSLIAYAGKLQLVLMDANYRPVLRTYIGDAWNSISQGNIFTEYMKSDGTYYRHGMVEWDAFTEFDGFMKFTQNETGIYGYVSGYGEALLYTPDSSEQQREITHIMILTGRLATYTYMPCYTDDIYLKWNDNPIPEEPEDPIIDSPIDIAYLFGTTGNSITWSPTSTDPASYQLFIDSELVDSGIWNGSSIIVNVDGHDVGLYEYLLVVYNGDGASASDSVFVIVTAITSTTSTTTSPTTTPSTSPTTSPTNVTGNGMGDMLIISISIGSFVVIIIFIGAICRNKNGTQSIPSVGTGYEW